MACERKYLRARFSVFLWLPTCAAVIAAGAVDGGRDVNQHGYIVGPTDVTADLNDIRELLDSGRWRLMELLPGVRVVEVGGPLATSAMQPQSLERPPNTPWSTLAGSQRYLRRKRPRGKRRGGLLGNLEVGDDESLLSEDEDESPEEEQVPSPSRRVGSRRTTYSCKETMIGPGRRLPRRRRECEDERKNQQDAQLTTTGLGGEEEPAELQPDNSRKELGVGRSERLNTGDNDNTGSSPEYIGESYDKVENNDGAITYRRNGAEMEKAIRGRSMVRGGIYSKASPQTAGEAGNKYLPYLGPLRPSGTGNTLPVQYQQQIQFSNNINDKHYNAAEADGRYCFLNERVSHSRPYHFQHGTENKSMRNLEGLRRPAAHDKSKTSTKHTFQTENKFTYNPKQMLETLHQMPQHFRTLLNPTPESQTNRRQAVEYTISPLKGLDLMPPSFWTLPKPSNDSVTGNQANGLSQNTPKGQHSTPQKNWILVSSTSDPSASNLHSDSNPYLFGQVSERELSETFTENHGSSEGLMLEQPNRNYYSLGYPEAHRKIHTAINDFSEGYLHQNKNYAVVEDSGPVIVPNLGNNVNTQKYLSFGDVRGRGIVPNSYQLPAGHLNTNAQNFGSRRRVMSHDQLSQQNEMKINAQHVPQSVENADGNNIKNKPKNASRSDFMSDGFPPEIQTLKSASFDIDTVVTSVAELMVDMGVGDENVLPLFSPVLMRMYQEYVRGTGYRIDGRDLIDILHNLYRLYGKQAGVSVGDFISMVKLKDWDFSETKTPAPNIADVD